MAINKITSAPTPVETINKINELIDAVGTLDTGKQDSIVTMLTVSANKTLAAADLGKQLYCTNSTAITITIPSGLGEGYNVTVVRWGAGTVTITPSSVTINGASSSVVLGDRYKGIASVIANAANVFGVHGALA